MDTTQGHILHYYLEWERWVEDYCKLTQAEKTRAHISKEWPFRFRLPYCVLPEAERTWNGRGENAVHTIDGLYVKNAY